MIAALMLVIPGSASAQDSSRISLDDPETSAIEDVDISEAEEAAENNSVEEETAEEGTAADEDDSDVDKSSSSDIVKGRGLQLGMSFIGVPGYIIDNWFSHHGNVWEDGAINMGVSLDYFLRFQAPCEMRFSLSWVNARTGSEYWIDKRYSDRPHLADYIVNNYSVLSLEVAAYHVVSIIDEIAFYYGGGFWGGIMLDEAYGYAVRSSCANASGDLSQCPHEPGKIPITQVPPAFGFVMVTLGFKFTLLETLTIRAEGGFKGYFYGQLGLGVEF